MKPAYIRRVETACEALRQEKIVILTDHSERENEGDFIFPAEFTTPDIINFIIRHSSGIVCLSLLSEQLNKLGLPLMVPPTDNTSHWQTPFTISIEAKHSITTGVSAHDRAKTILTAIRDDVCPDDIVKPGHVFPLRARTNGVLERAGHTEGAIDLLRLAQLKPMAVLCEVMNPDGTMARGKTLVQFAAHHQFNTVSITDIIDYRLRHESLIEETTSANLPLQDYGPFTITIIKEKFNNKEHCLLSAPYPPNTIPLVRIHSSCLTGDLFNSLRCDCHAQLHYSLNRLQQEGGFLIYLNQEGRGIGLLNKIKAYALQEQGLDTLEANQVLNLPIDARQYYLAAHILKARKLSAIRLLTNNPQKINDLKYYGIEKIIREPLPIFHNHHNLRYLKTKKHKLRHLITTEQLAY